MIWLFESLVKLKKLQEFDFFKTINFMNIKTFIIALFVTSAVFGQQLSDAEKNIILNGSVTVPLKIIQITDEQELKVLKSKSTDIDSNDKNIVVLKQRMFLAMRGDTRPGVGIAAPQVGINRNLIWVQRFDKPEKPFEFYVNPKIIWKSELMRLGPEGCLSIPQDRSDVYRHYTIKISYSKDGKTVEEIVEGFTAVIFQHETDHLNGILFTDRRAEQLQKTFLTQNAATNFFIEQK